MKINLLNKFHTDKLVNQLGIRKVKKKNFKKKPTIMLGWKPYEGEYDVDDEE